MNIGFLPLPVDPISKAMTHALRSTGITPLQHYYEAVRPSPARRYFRPRGWSRLCLVWGFLSREIFISRASSSFISFFVRSESRSFVPTRASPMSSRAGAVKVGRRTNLAACSALARPTPSTTARLVRSGWRSEGSSLSGADQSRHNLVSGGPRDPNHDAAMRIGSEAPKRRTHSFPRHNSHGTNRDPPPRIVIGDPSQADGLGRNCWVPSATSVYCVGRRTTPSGTTPSRTSRHKAIKSLRAKATIMSFAYRARSRCGLETTAPRCCSSET